MMSRHGTYGWLCMALGIISYDAWAVVTGHETLSSACHRACQSKLGRVAVTATWAGIGWHLLVTEGEMRNLLSRARKITIRYDFGQAPGTGIPIHVDVQTVEC